MAGGRGGEHLGHDPHRTHLADDLTDAYRALTRRPRAHPRRVDPVLMTTALTDELSRTTPTKACCRRAETITLGQMMDPPMTIDAVAGRIRRLLALADNTARRTGIPDHNRAVTAGVR